MLKSQECETKTLEIENKSPCCSERKLLDGGIAMNDQGETDRGSEGSGRDVRVHQGYGLGKKQ